MSRNPFASGLYRASPSPETNQEVVHLKELELAIFEFLGKLIRNFYTKYR